MQMKSKGAKKMNSKPKSPRRLRRGAATLLISACAAVGLMSAAAPAMADYGFSNFDVTFTNADGTPATQAGSHPFAMTTDLAVNRHGFVDGEIKDLFIEQVTGLVGDATAMPRCSTADFLRSDFTSNGCPNHTAVGVTAVNLGKSDFWFQNAVYNLVPPPGVAAKLGFTVSSVFVTINIGVKQSPEYNIQASLVNVAQTLKIFGSEFQLWGVPGDRQHDKLRGSCARGFLPNDYKGGFEPGGSCPANSVGKPFLTLPRSCTGPAATNYTTDAWENPGAYVSGNSITHDNATPPNPQGFVGCSQLGFKPTITAQPTTKAASSPTGLDFSLDVDDEGLTSVTGLAQSDIKKTVVTLPEGFSVNPSVAEGLNVCTEAQLAAETLSNQGCPEAAKLGSVEVESPLVEEPIKGALYQAAPFENPFGSLIALYIVVKNPKLGIMLKQPLKVDTNPVTGQITTTAENLPQLPYSHFKLHFREGARSPLASPPACGTYNVKAELTPWSGSETITTNSAFQVISGANSSPCPSGGTPPFHPGLEAGSINNAAGSYSPFNLRLSRNDGEQEFTHFSIKLPPGVTGKLAGVPFCADAAITLAKARTGPHGGQEELNR